MMIFRLGKHVIPKYYELFLNSWLFRAQYLPKISGSASPHLNIRDIRRFAVSLPPLAEQKRIVAKVESLLALCDGLATEVVAAEEVRGRLLAAVLNGE
jgi:type I restriction enzyme S subunit